MQLASDSRTFGKSRALFRRGKSYFPPVQVSPSASIGPRQETITKAILWGTDWTRATALLTYKQGVDAFRETDRLSDSERALLMGGALSRVYKWSPSKT